MPKGGCHSYTVYVDITYIYLLYLIQLPDGRVIKVGTERFQAPEALFTPVGTCCSCHSRFL